MLSRRQTAKIRAVEISREDIRDGLQRSRYLTTETVETVLFLGLMLEKPLLIEGPAGAGKTEIGKVLAETLSAERRLMEATPSQPQSLPSLPLPICKIGRAHMDRTCVVLLRRRLS